MNENTPEIPNNFFFLSVNLSTFLSDVCGEAEKKKENKKQNK